MANNLYEDSVSFDDQNYRIALSLLEISNSKENEKKSPSLDRMWTSDLDRLKTELSREKQLENAVKTLEASRSLGHCNKDCLYLLGKIELQRQEYARAIYYCKQVCLIPQRDCLFYTS